MKKINCIILAILAAVLLVSCGSENRKLEEISVQGQSPVAGKEKPEEREEIGVVRLKWRSYDSHREFPYGNMEYVDEETYAFLKRTYDEIDFAGECQMGNPELYEEYINEYKKLVDNEITFTEPETGEVCYIKDFPAFRPYHDEECDPGKFRYFLFDMDGDTNL